MAPDFIQLHNAVVQTLILSTEVPHAFYCFLPCVISSVACVCFPSAEKPFSTQETKYSDHTFFSLWSFSPDSIFCSFLSFFFSNFLNALSLLVGVSVPSKILCRFFKYFFSTFFSRFFLSASTTFAEGDVCLLLSCLEGEGLRDLL